MFMGERSLNAIVAALAALGRHGSLILPVGVFIGLLVPPLAALMKPLLIPGIIGPFIIALIRMDWQRLVDHVRQPLLIVILLLWLLIAAPFLVDILLGWLPLADGLHGSLVLMAAASPLMASASLAMIIGLDAPLAVVLTFAATALIPFTLPPIALYLLGIDIDIALVDLMLRLGAIIGGCFTIAWLIRHFLPKGFTERHAAPLDGLAIIGLIVFAIAIMDGVTVLMMERPGFVLAATLGVFGLNIFMQATAALLFAWRGLRTALTAGLCSGNRNLGLLLAALADRAGTDLLIVIAVAQLPIYILPMMQRRLYRRLAAAGSRWQPLAGLRSGSTPAMTALTEDDDHDGRKRPTSHRTHSRFLVRRRDQGTMVAIDTRLRRALPPTLRPSGGTGGERRPRHLGENRRRRARPLPAARSNAAQSPSRHAEGVRDRCESRRRRSTRHR